MPGMQLREKEPKNAHLERKTGLLKAKIEEKRKKRKGEGTAAVAAFGCGNGEDCVVEQLVDQSICSTLMQNPKGQ